MRTFLKAFAFGAALMLAVVSALARTAPAPADEQKSIGIVFRDGHRQNFEMSEIARIDFRTPMTVVFKDGHQQSIPASEIVRIEFGSAESGSMVSRRHFLGKWEVGEGNGGNFYITLEENGDAMKSIGANHGTWTVVDGEARIDWDDGWHDAIRKVGTKHEKLAYEPGKTFEDKPANVTPARNTQPRPI